MKQILAPIFAVIALASIALAWMRHHEAGALQQQIAALTAERDAAQKSLAALKSATDAAQENVARLTAERDAALMKAKGAVASIADKPPMPMPGADAPPPAKGGGMMQGIAKMFETEEGKKMMRAQMTMGLKMQYGSLAKDLKLDPKTADQVMALLGDRQMAITEASFGAMKGGLDEAATKEIATKAEDIKKDYDAKLKAVLGDQGMTQLQSYESTLPDRMMLNMHEQQFAATGSPLAPEQRDSLLQIMQAERQKSAPGAFDMSPSASPAKNMAALRDDAAIEKYIASEEDYQRRVLQAATQTLNPDQINALQESFKQQLEMQRFGIKMSKEMFGEGTGANAVAVPAPMQPAK